MTRYEVSFRPTARADLISLFDYIADEAGLDVATAYIDRIEAACLALESFPERGTRRDDLRPGLRMMGFERRVTIAFQIIGQEVVILRILYGGRELHRALGGDAS